MASSSAFDVATAAADLSQSCPSPRSARSAARHPAYNWSHVVRGDPEPTPALSSSIAASSSHVVAAAAAAFVDVLDRSRMEEAADAADANPSSDGQDEGSNGGGGTAARGKKPAWKKPLNGSTEVGTVMGAASWPALSETTKVSPKPTSSDVLKPGSDGSTSASSIPENSIPSPKINVNNTIPSSGQNLHAAPVRQKSMKRSSGGGSSSSVAPVNGGAAFPSPPPASSMMPQSAPDKQAAQQVSPRDQTAKNASNWNHGSRGVGLDSGWQPHGGGDHHRGHGGNRRGSNGSGGAHHNNYGNRRDQERGNFDGYHHRGFGGRESHMQQRGARPFIRPPAPVAPPFMSPASPVRPVANPMFYPDMPSPVFYIATQPPPDSFRGMPFIPPPAAHPTVFLPAIDPQRAMLLKQIDYYFSPENLCKDIFLRKNMDEQGWVPISLIAGFNRVKQITDSVLYILDTVRLSTVLEIQGEKIRRRNDWMNWVLLPSNSQFATSGQLSPATPDFDNLADHLQTVGLEVSTNQKIMTMPSRNNLALSRSASGNLGKQFQVVGDPNQGAGGQVSGRADSDQSKSGRSLVRSDTL